MAEIVPAIIADSFAELEEKIRAVEPYVERVHIDIMDGIFVGHKTIDGPAEIEKLDTHLKFEIHLMTQKPENKIVSWLDTRADRFLVHVESTQKMGEVIDFVRDADKEIFAVLNPDTPIDSLQDFVGDLDGVQCMTVYPGRHGADFVEEVVNKIEELKYFYPDLPIEVDGAIHQLTAQKCIQAGASILAVGSHVFLENKDIGKALSELVL